MMTDESTMFAPSWTRDGQRLIVNAEYDLWSLTLDGSGGTRLTNGAKEGLVHRVVALGAVERVEDLRVAQDRGERVVQLVRDTRDRLSQRRHLLCLQQLVIDLAHLVIQLLPLSDVAQQRFDTYARVADHLGARGEFHPDRRVVGAPQPQEVVRDVAVARQSVEECAPRERIEKAVGRQGQDGRLRYLG